MDEIEFRAWFRAICETAGGQSIWAEAHRFAPSYVSAVVQGKSRPSPRLLDALGLERVVTYRAKETGT